MNFIEAVKKMQNGERVRLPHWSNNTHAKKEGSCYLVSCNQSDSYHEFSEYEMLSDNWEIYQEEPKLHTFEEALKALKDGKTIRRKSIDNSMVLVNGRCTESSNDFDSPVYFYGASDFLANDWIIED